MHGNRYQHLLELSLIHQDKTAGLGSKAVDVAKGLANDASSAYKYIAKAPSAATGLKRIMFGGGEDVVKGIKNKVTTRWGAIDSGLFDARRLKGDLNSVGAKFNNKSIGLSADSNNLDFVKSDSILSGDALGSLGIRNRLRGKDGITGGIDKFREAGIDLTPEQFIQLRSRRAGLRGKARTTADIFLGYSPGKVTKERFLQGGLVGKGGVLTGDLAPDPDIARGFRASYNALRGGNIAEAARYAISPTLQTAGQAANLGLGYALPGAVVYSALADKSPGVTTGQKVRRAGAQATNLLINSAISPLGALQVGMMGPQLKYVDKLWGTEKPPPRTVIRRSIDESVGNAPPQPKKWVDQDKTKSELSRARKVTKGIYTVDKLTGGGLRALARV